MSGQASLGIDIGSTNVKICLVRAGSAEWSEVRAHDGDLAGTIQRILDERGVAPGIPAVVTGQEGRRNFAIPSVIAPVAVEEALQRLGLDVDAVVSVGGEDLVVYAVDANRHIVNTYAGNKCASGTGEFFAQQLKRMDLELDAVD